LKVSAVYPGFPSGEGKAAVAELIEKALGIWVPPSQAERQGPARYVPKAGAGQRFRLGCLLYERNQKRKSVEEFQNAVKTDPEYALAYAASAYVAGEAGNASVRDASLETLRQRSSQPLFQEALGAVLAALDRLEEAQKTLEPLLSLEEPMPRALTALAYVRFRRVDAEGARQVLGKLKAWPRAGQTIEVEVSAYLSGESPAEEQWKKPLPFVLKLLDLPTPLGLGLKDGADAARAPTEPGKGSP
jgi:tetratricopeptide (TPR) repeat protein